MPVTPPPDAPAKRLRDDDELPSDATAMLADVGLERKRKRLINASFIWEHFRKSEDRKSIVCLHCIPEGSTRFAYSGGTSTMNRHLRRKHGIYAPGKCAEDYEPSESGSSVLRLPLAIVPPSASPDLGESTKAAAADESKLPMRPTKQSMAQTQQWIHYAVTQYAPLEMDPDLHQLLKSKATGSFQSLQGPALIAMLREAALSLRSALHTFLRRQCALDVSLVGGDRPFELWFQALLESYGLESHLVAVTLGRDCPLAALQASFPNIVFVPCLLHQLEDLVRSIFDVAADVLHRCREVLLRNPRHNTPLDTPATSWWSTGDMISQVVAAESLWRNELAAEDWATLKDMAEVLVPIQSLLQNCLVESSVLEPLASLVFAMLHGIAKRLRSCKSPIQKALATGVSALLKHAPPICHVICAVDPRFKTLPFLSPNEKHAAFVTLSASMEKPASDSSDAEASAPCLPKRGKDSLMMAWSDMYPFEDSSALPLQATVQTYLDAATSLTAASPTDLVDPLAWWKVNVHVFGDMATLARSYLSVSPFCLPVQDVLSPSLRTRKLQLPTHLLDVVLFLRSALHVPELQDHNNKYMTTMV
ncbi:hypothetical protein SPRG_22326 [Saprolegnia parasitica CBS 223.65]|uniref:BED-type domain-containing protein n=1 Tax=Saprolegnia parasitica (strain CBS 223.65) TaxID=695850 RepID=A0A067BQF5_SAPPC|nr:hypothetical protein SPRG_22326 [Saprolegnia parasitica CBS 223.65]KDO20684.1 hypothetical protein SPRG_22326 [Saprolegnia parasitica CBS 223.65]|eukprot:XP_012208652.1 hypothetical protein SPRG_22326 [Saprolegnia parasitica CBS 223.65]